jgi:hypothetical protein
MINFNIIFSSSQYNSITFLDIYIITTTTTVFETEDKIQYDIKKKRTSKKEKKHAYKLLVRALGCVRWWWGPVIWQLGGVRWRLGREVVGGPVTRQLG